MLDSGEEFEGLVADGRSGKCWQSTVCGFNRANANLRDGTPICIRAIRPDDKDRLVGHFERLSSQSRYRRFLGFRKALTSQELGLFTELDFVGQVALVAMINDEDDGPESIVADGRYVALAGCQDTAELALSVVDLISARASARCYCDTSFCWRDAPDLDACRPTSWGRTVLLCASCSELAASPRSHPRACAV
jgi:hypothetical protein